MSLICHLNCKLRHVISSCTEVFIYFIENWSLYKLTPGKNDLHIDNCKASSGIKSVKHEGSKLWNELPTQLKSYNYSTKTFSTRFKLYLRN